MKKKSILNLPVEIKLGKFASPYGVESMEALNTPLVSRSYSFIYNPFTHMGALSKIELSSNTSAKIGIASGSDAWVEEGPKATFLSGIDFSWADSSLSLFSILSEGRYDRGLDLNHPNIIDIVYSNSIFTQTEYSVELLFGWQRNVPET